jgi:hypothetical protein
VTVRSTSGFEGLSALRDFALALSRGRHVGRTLARTEETFAALEANGDEGDGFREKQLLSEAEAGYRELIRRQLRQALTHRGRHLPQGMAAAYEEAERALNEVDQGDFPVERFLEGARGVEAFLSATSASVSATASWLDEIQTTTEQFSGVRADEWSLSEGARLVPLERGAALEVHGSGQAEWIERPIADCRLDLRYRPGSGAGVVLLRAVREPEGVTAYALRLEREQLVLEKRTPHGRRRLGLAQCALSRGEWYDLSMWLSTSLILVAVDGRPILQADDRPPLLGPGHVVLAGDRAKGIAYADIRLISAPRGMLPFPVEEHLRLPLSDLMFFEFPHPALTQVPTPSDVPIVVKPSGAPARLSPINAGRVPPDYTHTWAVDVTGFNSFRLQSSGIQPEWAEGDSLAVYDYSLPNPLVQTFDSDQDLITKSVTVQSPVEGESRRFYLTLRTGPGGSARGFQVSNVHSLGVGGNRKAVLVGDDLNYRPGGPLLDPAGVAGHTKLYAPWLPFSPGVPTGVSFPAPSPREGWYLLGRNTSNREAKFLALIYYNERTSRLRAYLYNLALSTDATYYEVSLSLAARAPGAAFSMLSGAFFNADPRPQRWSSASFTVPIWPPNSWAMVETPILYPMAEELPGAQHSPDPKLANHYYRPLYEEACEKGFSNMRLVVRAQGYQVGSIQGDLLGQAIGEAVQEASSSGHTGFDLLKGAASALASGKDYYDKGKDMHKSLQDFLSDKMKAGTPKSELQGLQALVGLGAGAVGGFLGIVGLGVGVYQAFFAKPDPLRLALELTIRGSMIGSMFTPLGTVEQTFFLPGRWSVEEAAQGNFPAGDLEWVDAEIPRYDRTLGHFGFRYDPGEVEFRLCQAYYAWDEEPESPLGDLRQYSRYVFPSREFVKQIDPPTPNAVVSIPRWLPVIFNPYAEILPLTPRPVATAVDHGIKITVDQPVTGSLLGIPEPWFEWSQDISPESHLNPELDDQSFPRGRFEVGAGSRMTIKVFPAEPTGIFPREATVLSLPQGIWLSVPPQAAFTPTTCRGFSDLVDLPTHTWWDVWVRGHYSSTTVSEALSPFPLRDIMYYWDLVYFHYPRSRKAANGDVPLYRGTAHLYSPVSIDHRSVGFNYTDDDGVWFYIIPKQKSQLLLS